MRLTWETVDRMAFFSFLLEIIKILKLWHAAHMNGKRHMPSPTNRSDLADVFLVFYSQILVSKYVVSKLYGEKKN